MEEAHVRAVRKHTLHSAQQQTHKGPRQRSRQHSWRAEPTPHYSSSPATPHQPTAADRLIGSLVPFVVLLTVICTLTGTSTSEPEALQVCTTGAKKKTASTHDAIVVWTRQPQQAMGRPCLMPQAHPPTHRHTLGHGQYDAVQRHIANGGDVAGPRHGDVAVHSAVAAAHKHIHPGGGDVEGGDRHHRRQLQARLALHTSVVHHACTQQGNNRSSSTEIHPSVCQSGWLVAGHISCKA